MARSRAKDSKHQGRTLQDPPRSGAGSYMLELSLGQRGCPAAGSEFYIPEVTPHPLPQSWLEDGRIWGMVPLEDYLSKS